MQWHRELTADDLPGLQQQLEWALQRQNRRFADRMRSPRGLRWRQRLVLGLSLFGLVLLGLTAAAYPVYARQHLLFFVGFTALFVVTLGLSAVMPRIDARLKRWGRRVAGRGIARRAARAMATLAAMVPCQADYVLADGELRTTIDALGVRRTTALDTVPAILSTPALVLLFRRPGALDPSQVVHVPGDAERDALVAALVAAGAAHEHLTGPVEGYVDALPRARVRT